MAVLQLCVGRRTLVFKIFHADHVPGALRDFLASPDHRFLGVAVDADVRRLSEDCGLAVANAVELRHVAVEVLARPDLWNAGLKALTREDVGRRVDVGGRRVDSRRRLMEVRRLSIHGDGSRRRRRPGSDVSSAVATAAAVRSWIRWIRCTKGPGALRSNHV
jgi:hypothetical protein